VLNHAIRRDNAKSYSPERAPATTAAVSMRIWLTRMVWWPVMAPITPAFLVDAGRVPGPGGVGEIWWVSSDIWVS